MKMNVEHATAGAVSHECRHGREPGWKRNVDQLWHTSALERCDGVVVVAVRGGPTA